MHIFIFVQTYSISYRLSSNLLCLYGRPCLILSKHFPFEKCCNKNEHKRCWVPNSNAFKCSNTHLHYPLRKKKQPGLIPHLKSNIWLASSPWGPIKHGICCHAAKPWVSWDIMKMYVLLCSCSWCINLLRKTWVKETGWPFPGIYFLVSLIPWHYVL